MGDTRRTRLDSLTSLRFFAAFGVVLYHCALYMPDVFTRRPRPMSLTIIMAVAAGIYLTFTSLFSGDYYDSRFTWFFFGWAAIESRRQVLVELGQLKRGVGVDDRVGHVSDDLGPVQHKVP